MLITTLYVKSYSNVMDEVERRHQEAGEGGNTGSLKTYVRNVTHTGCFEGGLGFLNKELGRGSNTAILRGTHSFKTPGNSKQHQGAGIVCVEVTVKAEI